MTPIIGITADRHESRIQVAQKYATCVTKAGGLPIILPPFSGQEGAIIELCDGFVFTGGDDPVMEQWGIETLQSATPCDGERQQFEISLLKHLANLPDTPVLGVCLGMQWMGILAGGTLKQELEPQFASNHRTGSHRVSGDLGDAIVHSSHHQAMSDAGSLAVIALANDGIIEAVRDLDRHWYVGVQWHPERTDDASLGQGMFDQLCVAATT